MAKIARLTVTRSVNSIIQRLVNSNKDGGIASISVVYTHKSGGTGIHEMHIENATDITPMVGMMEYTKHTLIEMMKDFTTDI